MLNDIQNVGKTLQCQFAFVSDKLHLFLSKFHTPKLGQVLLGKFYLKYVMFIDFKM